MSWENGFLKSEMSSQPTINIALCFPSVIFAPQGKLLALDLIVKVLESPQQQWPNIRPEFSEQMRQPLCLALLRNCLSPYDEAYTLATRLFTAIILQVNVMLTSAFTSTTQLLDFLSTRIILIGVMVEALRTYDRQN